MVTTLHKTGWTILVLLTAGCSSVVNRVAFHPDRAFTVADDLLPDGVQRVFAPTPDGVRLEMILVRSVQPVPKLVIYFHGNAGNISQRVFQLESIVSVTHATVLGVGYRGYGASTGRPSERGIFQDGETALRYARTEHGFAEERIFLCGVSLGSAVAVNVAMDRALAGVILISPLTSARDLARFHHHSSVAWIAGGAFDSLGKVSRLRAPVLVIHGTRDEVIPFRMGQELFAAISTPKQFVTIEDAGHNNLPGSNPQRFWSAISAFVRAPSPPES